MKPIVFLSLLLLQRADEALHLERSKRDANSLRLSSLTRRRHLLAQRLRRSLEPSVLARS